MENKFDSLMSRFEGYVSSVENASVTDAQLDRLEKLVVRLENAQKGGQPVPAQAVKEAAQTVQAAKQSVQQTPATASTATGATGGFLAKFKAAAYKNTEALLAVTKEQGNEHLAAGVGHYMDLLNSQERVLNTMAQCKKPVNLQFMI